MGSDLEVVPKWIVELLCENQLASAQALHLIESHRFVFQTSLTKPDGALTEAERWERLAFALYSQLVAVSNRAEEALKEIPLTPPASTGEQP